MVGQHPGAEVHRHRVDGDEQHGQRDERDERSRGREVVDEGRDHLQDPVEVQVLEQLVLEFGRVEVEVVLGRQIPQLADDVLEAALVLAQRVGKAHERPHRQADRAQEHRGQGGHRAQARQPRREPLPDEPPVYRADGEHQGQREERRSDHVLHLVEPRTAHRHEGDDDECLHSRRDRASGPSYLGPEPSPRAPGAHAASARLPSRGARRLDRRLPWELLRRAGLLGASAAGRRPFAWSRTGIRRVGGLGPAGRGRPVLLGVRGPGRARLSRWDSVLR